MSDSTKNLMEIYDDIDLCYKVMGLTFSDPPDRVDKVYNGLMEEYKQKLHSSDHAVRAEAQANIDQTHDLYERITNSMIYKDYAREYEKYKLLKAEEMSARKQKQEEEKKSMVNCPYCRKLIMPDSKKCIYCHGKIYTPMEMLMLKVFSKRNVIVMAVVLVCIAAGIILATNPQLIRSLR